MIGGLTEKGTAPFCVLGGQFPLSSTLPLFASRLARLSVNLRVL